MVGVHRNADLLEIVDAMSSSAASRAACTAGSRIATKIPIMAITTSSSTRVKPLERLDAKQGKARCIDSTSPRQTMRPSGNVHAYLYYVNNKARV